MGFFVFQKWSTWSKRGNSNTGTSNTEEYISSVRSFHCLFCIIFNLIKIGHCAKMNYPPSCLCVAGANNIYQKKKTQSLTLSVWHNVKVIVVLDTLDLYSCYIDIHVLLCQVLTEQNRPNYTESRPILFLWWEWNNSPWGFYLCVDRIRHGAYSNAQTPLKHWSIIQSWDRINALNRIKSKTHYFCTVDSFFFTSIIFPNSVVLYTITSI